MKCIHCEGEISWNPELLRWENYNGMFKQYCWIDPTLGSELHAPPSGADVALTAEQRMLGALWNIASYPTKSTDASVLAMQRIASEALAALGQS